VFWVLKLTRRKRVGSANLHRRQAIGNSDERVKHYYLCRKCFVLVALEGSLAATMRSWHLHCAALIVHHAAAGAILSTHLCVSPHAGHDWRNTRNEQQCYRSELAKQVHRQN
jgi:hypothetical protein